MNRHVWIPAALLLTLSGPAWSEEGPPPPPPPPEMRSGPPGGHAGPGMPGHPPLHMAGPPGRPPGPPPVPPEVEKEFLEFLQSQDPDRAAELSELRKSRPEVYRHALASHVERYMFLKQMKEEDPEGYQLGLEELKLDGRVRKLARAYTQTQDKEQRAALRKQAEEAVARLFDIRQQNRRRHVERMEKELARLKSQVDERQKKRQAIVERRVEEVLSDPDLEW
ncbi:MAG: hypothetical protein AB1758_12935 [Candidatus Eremiobacterota bacterium]